MKDWICGQCGLMHSEHPAGMRERLAEIDAEIASVEQWASKLTALNEERQAILRALAEAR
jgi:hypothetical protein